MNIKPFHKLILQTDCTPLSSQQIESTCTTSVHFSQCHSLTKLSRGAAIKNNLSAFIFSMPSQSSVSHVVSGQSSVRLSELSWDDDERTCLTGLLVVISAQSRVVHHTSSLQRVALICCAGAIIRYRVLEICVIVRGVFWSIVYAYLWFSFYLLVSHFILKGKSTVA